MYPHYVWLVFRNICPVDTEEQGKGLGLLRQRLKTLFSDRFKTPFAVTPITPRRGPGPTEEPQEGFDKVRYSLVERFVLSELLLVTGIEPEK